jgi:hypothetical protein
MKMPNIIKELDSVIDCYNPNWDIIFRFLFLFITTTFRILIFSKRFKFYSFTETKNQ